jgi:hypothetical protein
MIGRLFTTISTYRLADPMPLPRPIRVRIGRRFAAKKRIYPSRIEFAIKIKKIPVEK